MKMTKRIIAVLLCLAALLSTCITCFAADEHTISDEEKTTNRYYFYMPSLWKNKYSNTVGIYWWDGTDACTSWPGYEAKKTDVKDVYYYDVPTDVPMFVWNNFVDGGTDTKADIYYCDLSTRYIISEFYFPDEVSVYPEGIESFDNMIYVTDIFINYGDTSKTKVSYEGEWYYYYGNGEYGLTPEKSNAFCSSPYLMKKLKTGEFALGDVNADGKINIKDSTAIQKYCAKLIDFDEAQFKRADFTTDCGDVNINDATYIQKFAANLLNNLWDSRQ